MFIHDFLIVQWIGLRENLQESPILNGKIYGFLKWICCYNRGYIGDLCCNLEVDGRRGPAWRFPHQIWVGDTCQELVSN